MEEREITIVKGGRQTPFSRGILAQTLAQAGAGPEMAHQIASEVRAELAAEQRFTVEEEEVLARVREKLVKKDAIAVGRLDKWRILRESSEPIVVLIGGATGVGTSTLAADIARRLNIQSVVGTDSVREVLRHAISPEDRKSTRLNSSHANISYAVFCLKKKKNSYTVHHAQRRSVLW